MTFELPKGNELDNRHKAQCSVCKHKDCKQIEEDFVCGRPVTSKRDDTKQKGKKWKDLSICSIYGIDKTPLYNHMSRKGFVEMRKKHPLQMARWIVEEHYADVDYKGSDIRALISDLAKAEGELGPEQQVNVTQNIAQWGDKFKEFTEEELRKMKVEAFNRAKRLPSSN